MTHSLFAILLAVSISACASAQNPGELAVSTPTDFAVIDGEEGSAMGTGAFASESGCYWISGDGDEVGCISHALEMGYVTSRMVVVDVESGARHDLGVTFDGPIDDASGVKPNGVVAVNRVFREGEFRAVSESFFGDKLPGDAMALTAPSVPEPQVAECCQMVPQSASVFDDVVAVAYGISCRYSPEPSAGACFIEDYNDESHPLDVGFVVQRM